MILIRQWVIEMRFECEEIEDEMWVTIYLTLDEAKALEYVEGDAKPYDASNIIGLMEDEGYTCLVVTDLDDEAPLVVDIYNLPSYAAAYWIDEETKEIWVYIELSFKERCE